MFAIMKNLTILGALFLSMTILFSCGDKKSDKDKKKDKFKKEIKDPCDILDYSVEIFENLERLSDEYDDIDELEDDKKDKKKVDDYFDELADAWKYAFRKFDEDMEEVFNEDCKDSRDAEAVYQRIEDFYEYRFDGFHKFIRNEIDKTEDSDNKRPRRYS